MNRVVSALGLHVFSTILGDDVHRKWKKECYIPLMRNSSV